MKQVNRIQRTTALASLGVVALSGLALWQAGCASVKAVPGTTAASDVLLRPPTAIYIAPFEISSGMWQGRANKPAERARIRDWLITELETELANIAPTHLLPGDTTPDSGWLVTGRFVRVNPGSKFQRMFIGLGAGGSKLETKVNIYDLAVSQQQPILTVNTTGGSNLQTGPAALVTNATSNDINRTAREIREFIASRLWERPDRSKPALTGDSSLKPVELRTGPR